MNEAANVIRGTIIKVPAGEPGLIMANSKQFTFRVEGVWVSPVAPAPNQAVDLTVDDDGQVTRVAVVDPQILAREKLEQLKGAAGEHGQQAAAMAMANLKIVSSRMGTVMLVASLVLWLAWFLMPTLQLNIGGMNLRSFTFSELLGLSLTNGDPSTHFGLWSFLGLVAITLPWVAPWLRQSWAPMLNVVPLAFVALTYIEFRWEIHSAASDVIKQAGGGGSLGGAMMDRMVNEVMGAVSVGIGLWIVLAAAIVLAARGFMGYRKAGATA